MSTRIDTLIKQQIATDSDLANLMQSYEDALDNHRPFRNRAIRNIKYHASLTPTDVIQNVWLRELAQKGLPAKNYNLIQLFVEGHVGNYLNYRTTPKFSTQEVYKKSTDKLNEIFLTDADNFKYDEAWQEFAQNACLIRGVSEIKIIRSDAYPRGRIKLVNHQSTDVIFDATVKSNNIARDSKYCFKEYNLTPLDLVYMFPEKRDQLEMMLYNFAKEYTDGGNLQSKFETVRQAYWNNTVKVVESFHIYPKTTVKEFDVKNGVLLPNTGFSLGSEDDAIAKQVWAGEKGIEISSDIKRIIKKSEVLMVTTMVPEWGLLLEHRKDQRQIMRPDGTIRLPFFTCSFVTVGGESIGVPDYAIDSQDDINLAELNKSKYLHKMPIGGKTIYHPLIHGDRPEKKQDFIDNFNDNTIPFEMSHDAPLGQRLVDIVGQQSIPRDVLGDESFKISLLKEILRLPPAMQGQVGKSGESALLHSRKVADANSMLQNSIESWQIAQREFHESWLFLAIKIYGGDSQDAIITNMDRKFTREGVTVEVNKFKGISQNGEIQLEDAISDIDPFKVQIIPVKKNYNMRSVRRDIVAAILQQIPRTDQNEAIFAVLQSELIDNVEELDPNDKIILEQINKLILEESRNKLLLRNLTIESEINARIAQTNAVLNSPENMNTAPDQGVNVNNQVQNQIAPNPQQVNQPAQI